MADREKLVELIMIPSKTLEEEEAERIVNYMIAHGVTVKEKRRPLTVEEVRAKQNEIVYLEYAQNKLEEFPVLLAFFGAFYAEFEKYVGEGIDFPIDEYGYKWRCWAERPTDAECKNAKWEEQILKIGYIRRNNLELNPQLTEKFTFKEATFTRRISRRGDRCYSKMLYEPVDYEEIVDNANMMKSDHGLIVVNEPFLLDNELREKVVKWVEWANKADPKEYDFFA